MRLHNWRIHEINKDSLVPLVHVICSKVSLSEMVRCNWVKLCGEDRKVRILRHYSLGSVRGTEQVYKDNMILKKKDKNMVGENIKIIGDT